MASNEDVYQELVEILHNCEDDLAGQTCNPTKYLNKLSELFERETEKFLKQDQDPFDEKYPIASNSNCALGLFLGALVKKDSLFTKLVNHYLREDYFSSLGLMQSSTEVNVAVCRLILSLLLYGLDIPQVFKDSGSTLDKLFVWAEKADEPLRTYSIGLLAAAMNIPEYYASFKDQNAQLVPIILKHLWEMKNEVKNCKSSIRHSYSLRSRTVKSMDQSPSVMRRESVQLINSDCSNSSSTEPEMMSSSIVGTYQMHPIQKETKEIFMLKYLRSIGKYNSSMGHMYEHHALKLVFHYINLRHTNHAQLSFEALRFLGSLLVHKKFCAKFVNMGGIEILLKVPRPSLLADGVALCLQHLASCEEAIEQICLLPDHIFTEFIQYALWLLESSHQSSRTYAVIFFGMTFKFSAILEKFDDLEGLGKMLNILSTSPVFQNNILRAMYDELSIVMMWRTIKQVCCSIKYYFYSHLAIRVHQLQTVSSATSSSSSCCSSISFSKHSTPAYKPLNVSQDSIEQNNEYLLEHLPHHARWKAVENFVSLKGLEILLRLFATEMLDDWLTSDKTHAVVSALDTIPVCSVMPIVQLGLCEKITVHTRNEATSDFYDVVSDKNQPLGSMPEIQKAAISVLINTLCAPVHKPSSPSTFTTLKEGSLSTSCSPEGKINSREDIIKNTWDCVRNSNGLMYLLNLLHKKFPITDADCIRGLACRALVGLSRNEPVRQIISKLPIITSGQLQLLMEEPVLEDKTIEHIKFQRYALELIEEVSGRSKSQESSFSTDVSIQSIHKENLIAHTQKNTNQASSLHGDQFSKKEKSLVKTIPHSRQNEKCTSFDGIEVENLIDQLALCENPVVSCPTIESSSVASPHKLVQIPPSNFVTRFTNQSYDGSTSATKSRATNRKFIYSRYRPSRVFKAIDNELIYSCAFTADDQCLLVGSSCGELRLVNKYNGDIIAEKEVHEVLVTSLVPHKFGDLLLTSGFNNSGDLESALVDIKNNFENQFMLDDCRHAEFTHANDKVLGTSGATAKIYDLHSGQVIQEFKPKISNLYENNKAALDPTDDLLLTDGVMFDVRSGKEVHKFDKINPDMNGIFHKNRLEIISSSEIWDLKTFHLLQTIKSLELCTPIFNNYNDVIFGLHGSKNVSEEDEDESGYGPDFEVIDASDYSSIATIGVTGTVRSLAVNTKDTQIAVTDAENFSLAVVRLYDIGMVRHEEESGDDDLENGY